MVMILEADGSITFTEGKPEKLMLRNFSVDPNNPNHYIPKFLPCKFRINLSRMSPCGRRPIFLWHCQKFGKSVTCLDCKNCEVRDGGEA